MLFCSLKGNTHKNVKIGKHFGTNFMKISSERFRSYGLLNISYLLSMWAAILSCHAYQTKIKKYRFTANYSDFALEIGIFNEFKFL